MKLFLKDLYPDPCSSHPQALYSVIIALKVRSGTHVGKFRPQLIELTNFKPKLFIRLIMNKPY